MIKDIFKIYLGGIFIGEAIKSLNNITFGNSAGNILGAGFLADTSNKVIKWLK